MPTKRPTPFTPRQLAACERALARKKKADAALSALVHRLSKSHGIQHRQACEIGGIFAGGPASLEASMPCPCGLPYLNPFTGLTESAAPALENMGERAAASLLARVTPKEV